mgnify:CR=1 FL=1
MPTEQQSSGHHVDAKLRSNWRDIGGLCSLAVILAELLEDRAWTNMNLCEAISPAWIKCGFKRRRPLAMLNQVWDKTKRLLILEDGAGYCHQDPERSRIYWYGIVRSSDDAVKVFAMHWSQVVSRIYTLESMALHLLKTQEMTTEHRVCCELARRAATFVREQVVKEVEDRCEATAEGVMNRGRRILLTVEQEMALELTRLPALPAAFKRQLFDVSRNDGGNDGAQ